MAQMAHAASFTSTVSRDGKTLVPLDGEIEAGDHKKLAPIIVAADNTRRRVSTLYLNSPGGSLLEAIEIAKAVTLQDISTVVADASQCASACFVVFAAGLKKSAGYGAKIGVHGVSEDGRDTPAARSATVSMARLVSGVANVPHSVVGRMVLTPPDQMAWLTPDELRSMNVTLTSKPPQPAAGVERSPARTTAPPDGVAKPGGESWPEFAAKVEARSREQLGPNYRTRKCDQKLGLCIVSFGYRSDDGTLTVVQIFEYPDGRIQDRLVCKNNAKDDNRTCTSWDTGKKIRHVKTADGTRQSFTE
jgi:hypothetical protein